MAISLSCPNCRKALKVPDDRAGKLAQCPACMKKFTVMPTNAPAVHPTTAEQIRANQPRVSISNGTIMWTVVLVGIVAVVLAIVFGPLRVLHQWDALQPHAQGDVEDVVIRGLQSYTSHQPWFDPKKDHLTAAVRQMSFSFWPHSMSLPDQIPFAGMSSQGKFSGTYSTRTGEVSANVEVGARTFEGVESDITKPTGQIHVTGRSDHGNLSVEVNGQNATVVTVYSTTNP